jgi:CheY-like chemotaxis protein
MPLDSTYRRTAAGDEALRSVDTAIPVDYRRILCIIDGNTHANVVRGRLRQYSDKLIADWLAELEEIGFIEPAEAGDAYDLDFEPLASDGRTGLNSIPGEQRRIDDEARAADSALKGEGVYLAAERLQHRDPLWKDPGQTVVLLVEDDPDQAALGDLRVSMAGYQVRLAGSSREMLMALLTQPAVDLVLLDVMLPDRDGFEILAGIRRHHRYSLLPVIMLTARTGTEDIRRGLDLGADGYITKPYSKNLLIDTIRRVLRQI